MNDEAPADPTLQLARLIGKAIANDPASNAAEVAHTAQAILTASNGVRERFGTAIAHAALDALVGSPAPGQTKHPRLRAQDVFRK